MEKFWRYENKLVILMFFAVGFVFFDRLAISFLIPFMQGDLSMSNTQVGLLSSALALTWAISGYLVSFMADKLENKKMTLVISVVVFSLCSLLSGIATSFIMLLAFRLIMGLAEGPVVPISQSSVAQESSESRRGFNMGIVQGSAAGLLGSVLAPLIIVALANSFGWRNAFYLTIIPGLILAFFIWKTMREPKNMALGHGAGGKAQEHVKFSEVVKHRNIWLGIIISCFFVTWYITSVTFLPLFLIEFKHLNPSNMSFAMSALGIGAVVWGFASPAISDRVGRKPVLTLFLVVSILVPILLITTSNSLGLIALLLFFAGGGVAVMTLYMSTIPAESVAPKYIAAAVGLIMGIGEVLGGVVAPSLAGIAADHYGIQAPFIITASAAAVATLLSLFLIETAPLVIKRRGNLNPIGIGQ
jgi:MFS transporter, ACS family, hexuronate transporter